MKTFVNGIYSKEVHPKAPEFIKGKLSVHVNNFSDWLNANKGLADEKGYINMTILNGQKGRYIEVDTWKPNTPQTAPVAPQTAYKVPTVQIESLPKLDYGEVIDESSIPF